jgi:hypothetical protein
LQLEKQKINSLWQLDKNMQPSHKYIHAWMLSQKKRNKPKIRTHTHTHTHTHTLNTHSLIHSFKKCVIFFMFVFVCIKWLLTYRSDNSIKRSTRSKTKTTITTKKNKSSNQFTLKFIRLESNMLLLPFVCLFVCLFVCCSLKDRLHWCTNQSMKEVWCQRCNHSTWNVQPQKSLFTQSLRVSHYSSKQLHFNHLTIQFIPYTHTQP